MGPMAVSRCEKEHFADYMAANLVACLAGILVLAFFPTYMDRVAEGLYDVPVNPTFFDRLRIFWYSLDGSETAYNLLPSFHCINRLNYYASQTVSAPDGRRIMIGWMDNWETCKEAPRRHPWYGQMSMPRELFIRGNRLCQRPVREIENLWQDTVIHERVQVQESVSLEGVQGRTLDMKVTLFPEKSACRRFTLHVAEDCSHYIQIRCDLARGELIFDRSHGGSCRDIAHTRHVQAETVDGKLTLRLLMDKESIELFVNDGERAVTSLSPTPPEADRITFAADAAITLSVEAHHLK